MAQPPEVWSFDALLSQRDDWEPIVEAARAFVEHRQSPQPWQLGKRHTDAEWAEQEAWHDEDNRRVAALIAAVDGQRA